MKLSKQDIEYFVNIFREDMDFPNKKASYNFLSKSQKYNDDEETWTLTKELFKLCVKKHNQLKSHTIMTDQPTVVDETMSSKLIRYNDVISTMFETYKETNGREYHSLYKEMTDYFLNECIGLDEEQEDLVGGLSWDLDQIHKKMLVAIGVSIDSWKDMGEKEREKDIIFSPQSHKVFLDELNENITIESGVDRSRLQSYLKDFKQNIRLRIFETI
jgi:hypothetical protein